MPVKIPNYLDERPTSLKHPLTIMQDAAEDMARQTNGLVVGNVFVLNPGGANLFRYTFYLVAPSLNDYTDPLFYAWHTVNPYPIWLLPAGGKQGKDEKKYAEPADFEQALSGLFASDMARQRIYVLLDAMKAK